MFKKILGLAIVLVLSQNAFAELPGKDKLSTLKDKLGERIQAKLINEGGKCLKGDGEVKTSEGEVNTSDGRVNTVDCGAAPDQLWRFDNGRLLNLGSNKCLDVPDMNGDQVQIMECNDAPNQQFKLEQGRLQNQGGKCLDVPDMNGELVQIMECNDAPNQKWEMR